VWQGYGKVEMRGEKPAKFCVIAECGELKERDDRGMFPKDGSSDSHPDFSRMQIQI
jgi:peptidyl-prolyl isomerase D